MFVVLVAVVDVSSQGIQLIIVIVIVLITVDKVLIVVDDIAI